MRYAILFLLAGPAYANDTEEEPRVMYKQKTEIDFDGVEVQGELVKPQGAMMIDRKRAKLRYSPPTIQPSRFKNSSSVA